MAFDADLTLLYQFAADKALTSVGGKGPTLGITRATEATYFDDAGVLQTAASGAARFDHLPVSPFTSLGLLVEEARTNICLYSEDLSNAAWVVSNITKGSDSVTAPDGAANTAVRLTASAANGTCLQTITSVIDDYVYSVYMKRVTGTGDIDLTLDNGTTWTTKTLTSSWQRFDIVDASETNPVIGVRIVTDTDAIDFWGSDVNKNAAFPTSYIQTVASSVTRNQDLVNTTDVSWLDTAATAVGTFYVRGAPTELNGVNSRILSVDPSAGSNRIYFSTLPTNLRLDATNSGGSNTVTGAGTAITSGTTFEIAAAYENDDAVFAKDNQIDASPDTDCLFPLSASMTTLRLGADFNNGKPMSMHFAEVRYYNVRKSDTFVQQLSNGEIEENASQPLAAFYSVTQFVIRSSQ